VLLTTRFLARVLSVFLIPLGAASATQWIVAADGSGQFTDIQPAVDVAQSGDVIRVLAGSYGAIDLAEKNLSIMGAGADSVTVGSVIIGAIGPGFASLSGVTIGQDTAITSSQGSVILRDCVGEDLAVVGCQQVFLENWHGRRGSSDTVTALWIATSHFEGAAGKDAVYAGTPGSWSQLPTAGTNAFGARASKLFVTASEFVGGSGGQGSCSATQGFLAGAVGGNGLEDELGNCSFWLATSTFTAGSGGSGGSQCSQTPGAVGLKTLPSTKVTSDTTGGNLFPLSTLTPSVLGKNTTIKIWGYPGDSILLLIGTDANLKLDSGALGFPLGLNLNLGHVTFWPLTRQIGLDGTVKWKHKIPNDPALLGTPVFLQALLVPSLLSGPHPFLLTGVSVSIITDIAD
jgi:hypothetical protein